MPARFHYLDKDELLEVFRKAKILNKAGALPRLPGRTDRRGDKTRLQKIQADFDEALRAFDGEVARAEVEREWLKARGQSREERQRRRTIHQDRRAKAWLRRENDKRRKEGKPPLLSPPARRPRGQPKRDERGTPEDRLVWGLASVVVLELGLGFGRPRVRVDAEGRPRREDVKPLWFTTSIEVQEYGKPEKPSGPLVLLIHGICRVLVENFDKQVEAKLVPHLTAESRRRVGALTPSSLRERLRRRRWVPLKDSLS
jgi:hypothetical protein